MGLTFCTEFLLCWCCFYHLLSHFDYLFLFLNNAGDYVISEMPLMFISGADLEDVAF